MGALNFIGGANQAQAQANQAFQQAQAARFEQWKNKRQWEHGEFMGRMQNQIKNRQTAKVNAQRWMQNRAIAKAANLNRAEEEFWIRWNFDNDTDQLSKKHQQVNNSLLASMDKRNINIRSGNARQLLRASLDNATDQLAERRLAGKNQMRSAERKQIAALSQRDFGYNAHTVRIPGLYIDSPTIDPSAAASSAYSTGMTSAIVSGISGGLQGAFMGSQMSSSGGGSGGGGGNFSGNTVNVSLF